jgi:hypothetical protein
MAINRTLVSLRVAITFLTFCATAASTDHRKEHIEAATFTAQCDSYRLHVSGSGVDKPKPLVGYNITLTPPSGPPLIITDSFPVTPNSDGAFQKTFSNSWKTFGFTLDGKHRLSGSAVLVIGLTPLSTATIKFSSITLSCRRK